MAGRTRHRWPPWSCVPRQPSAAQPTARWRDPAVRRFFPKAAPLPVRQQTALQWTMRRCGRAFRCGRYQSAVSSAYIVKFVIPHDGKREKVRSEEHTYDLPSLMRNLYDIIYLNKKKTKNMKTTRLKYIYKIE